MLGRPRQVRPETLNFLVQLSLNDLIEHVWRQVEVPLEVDPLFWKIEFVQAVEVNRRVAPLSQDVLPDGGAVDLRLGDRRFNDNHDWAVAGQIQAVQNVLFPTLDVDL